MSGKYRPTQYCHPEFIFRVKRPIQHFNPPTAYNTNTITNNPHRKATHLRVPLRVVKYRGSSSSPALATEHKPVQKTNMTTTSDSQEKLDSKRASKRASGKWRSWETTEGAIRAPHRSMMKAMGLSDKDIAAPFVGIASTHNEVTPCNSGIAPLVEEVKRGVFAAEGTPFTFGTITVSDAISMGTEGMRGSLVSREVIADSIETVIFAERYDGLVVVAGCDKSLPGGMMAMARLNVPEDPSCPARSTAKISRSRTCSKPLGNSKPAKSMPANSLILKITHVLDPVHVAECSQQTPCHQSVKPLASPSLDQHPSQTSISAKLLRHEKPGTLY